MQKSRENYREVLPPGQMSCRQHLAVFGVAVLAVRVHTQTPCVLRAVERCAVTRRPHILGLRQGIFVTSGGPRCPLPASPLPASLLYVCLWQTAERSNLGQNLSLGHTRGDMHTLLVGTGVL